MYLSQGDWSDLGVERQIHGVIRLLKAGYVKGKKSKVAARWKRTKLNHRLQ